LKFTDIVDPIELAKQSLFSIINAQKSWKGFRLMMYGTTGVGKSTLWKYLQTQKMVDPNSIDKTYKITPIQKFRLKTIRLSYIKVGILATDLPGDKEYRDTWKEALLKVKPHGIIFLLDNCRDTNNLPPSGFKSKRLEEHREALEHLINLIVEHREVAKKLQAFAITVNKCDSFPTGLTYGNILEKSNINTSLLNLNELDSCRSTAFQCSALYGRHVPEMLKWMVKNMSYN
jgi:GTPase SAR1 family protein